MRKKMAHLSSSERKGFEIAYQYLKSFPGWEMENIFTEETPEYRELAEISRVFYVRDKMNRLSLAAHEAGHAIVMAATYGAVGEAVIDVKEHPKGLLGWVIPVNWSDDASAGQMIDQKEIMLCKPVVTRNILIKSAGFVGERLTGKKTGNNHEKFLAYCMCRHLDDQGVTEPLMNWDYYINWCRKVISNNEKLFWRVVDDLLATSKLSDSAKNLLHTSIKKEPTKLFF